MKIRRLKHCCFAASLVLAVTLSPVRTAAAEFGANVPSSSNLDSSGEVPTPRQAVSLGLGSDSKKWKVGYGVGSRISILMEMVPEGEDVSSWNELSSSVVLFGVPAEGYLEKWKSGLRSAGARIVEEETLPDGSFWVAYKSPDENGLWRYMQGQDGVYGVSYQTRPPTEDGGRIETWRKILRGARLQSNPTLEQIR